MGKEPSLVILEEGKDERPCIIVKDKWVHRALDMRLERRCVHNRQWDNQADGEDAVAPNPRTEVGNNRRNHAVHISAELSRTFPL